MALLILIVAMLAFASPAAADAPGRPGGDAARWTPANKSGFGTSASSRSRVWFTLGQGGLTEVYYPDLGTPAARDLQFVVTDGRTFAEREADMTTVTEPVDARSLAYRQVSTSRAGRYRITKTFVTDSRRQSVVADVAFESLDGNPYALYAVYDPSVSGDGSDDSARATRASATAADRDAATAMLARTAFTRTSVGYLGDSDGWTYLERAQTILRHPAARRGNVVLTGRLAVNGLPGGQHATLALGFGRTRDDALGSARASLAQGFPQVSQRYSTEWDGYLSRLLPPPASAAPYSALYDRSVMTLAALEDKAHPGASVAAPAMPWAFGQGLEKPSGPYHLVWARDLYQAATAFLAAGDRGAAERALRFLFNHQQKADGSFPQNSEVTGKPHWTGLQMDEVAFPIVLAGQLGRHDFRTWVHVREAADFIVREGPVSKQERWENQSGYSPGTIAAEIAALTIASDIATRNGETGDARRYQRVADAWQRGVQNWTATSSGPYSPAPYYLRLTKHRDPNRATRYDVGDGGPKAIDQRRVVDPSFLELVRLGVKRPDDPVIVNSLGVIDEQLAVDTPNGRFWHRYVGDGYGEKPDGSMWEVSEKESKGTIGRAWPIFAGERGEYELLSGRPATDGLAAMAASANDGLMLPEQVWDGAPPSGAAGFAPGEGTTSATPLAWSHAQFIRLARSIDAGAPVEQPALVACRYAGRCP